jgi:hypothetical protein
MLNVGDRSVSQERRRLRHRLSDDRNAQNLFKGFLENVTIEEPVEKLILLRLIKNAQMQGARNPEE